MFSTEDVTRLHKIRKSLTDSLSELDAIIAVGTVGCSILFLDCGLNKIAAIKAVREITSWGLKESKDFVESAPNRISKKDFNVISPVQAAAILNNAGCNAQLCKAEECEGCTFRFQCFTS